MDTQAQEPILELNGIYKSFVDKTGDKVGVLQDISLAIPQGSITGIIGKSGAGKSTLLRCMNLLERPDQGNVFFEGTDLTQAPRDILRQKRHHLGMIFQHFNLLSRRTLEDNVALPLEIAGHPKAKRRKTAQSLLNRLGLSDRENDYPSNLSGGQKQRVAIARALAGNARVLLCDEITSALDPETTTDILHLLRTLRDELNLTIILITHEMSVIRAICDHVFVMDAGKVAEQGPAEHIFSRPKHPATQALLKPFLKQSIPEFIQDRLQEKLCETKENKAILRLIFSGASAQEPLVSQFIRKAHTDVNILAGFMDQIGDTTFGTLVVEIPNNPAILEQTCTFLSTRGVAVEQLGFITHD